MDKKIDWLEPWGSLSTDPSAFENELHREIGIQHVLSGKKVTAIGRRYDCDDYLFYVYGTDFTYAVVHLTYSKTREVDPQFPHTRVFSDLNDWIENCMIPDHADFI